MANPLSVLTGTLVKLLKPPIREPKCSNPPGPPMMNLPTILNPECSNNKPLSHPIHRTRTLLTCLQVVGNSTFSINKLHLGDFMMDLTVYLNLKTTNPKSFLSNRTYHTLHMELKRRTSSWVSWKSIKHQEAAVGCSWQTAVCSRILTDSKLLTWKLTKKPIT